MTTWQFEIENGVRGWVVPLRTDHPPESDELHFLSDDGWDTLLSGPIAVRKSDDPQQVEALLEQRCPNARFVRAALEPGQYYNRMWRGPGDPPLHRLLAVEFVSAAQAVRSLIRAMREVFDTVEPRPRNRAAFGNVMRQVLMLACTEVEASCKAVLRANGYPKDPETTNHYCTLIEPMLLGDWSASLRWFPGWGSIRPFKTWDASKPTKSLPWYDSYNRVKHDRETNAHEATLEAMVNAVTAAAVLLAAQFGPAALVDDPTLNEIAVTPPTWPLGQEYGPPWLDLECADRFRFAHRHGEVCMEWSGVNYPWR